MGTISSNAPFSSVLNRNLTCFLVARVDTGGISSAQDALLSYGNGGNGKWELRSANAATFNSKLAKNSTWMSTVNYTVPLDTLHLFTIDFSVNSSTSSMWVNGTLVNASTPDPIGLAEKQRITLMGNRANPLRPLAARWLKSSFFAASIPCIGDGWKDTSLTVGPFSPPCPQTTLTASPCPARPLLSLR